MPDDLLLTADRLFTGELPIEEHHPFRGAGELAEVQPGVAFVQAFANSAVFSTADGLVVVDTSGVFHAALVHASVRNWSDARLDTAIFTHGHIDHVFGVELYEEEARAHDWRPPRVIAHELIGPRFERYVRTAEYNAIVNRRQFGLPALQWPVEYRYPDLTYRDVLSIEVGGEHFELRHDRGETDDGTWVWIPERRVLCTGDLFVWASPNCGNPQKVQRYAADWAVAMRKMAALDAEILLPGHGLPIVGADRVRHALLDSAALLESLLEQTLAMMNEGARLDDIVHTVRGPQELLERPYLRPIYDEPEFVVRGIWRFYGGWWDGNPAHLKPAPAGDLARELASLAGGASALAQRASELASAGELRLAGHLAELAALAAPDDSGVHRVRADVFGARARAEASTMSKGVFGWAERESRERI
ncbi:MAG TPA: alkyl sulfatase dimerization domain-containing protein [Acidimicrobiia bacterium]|jgi:alkyl sulfatase BDS1-like metallo-beta-lactamase superfamily hydrolase|nr:alkyl sulfatase dimerization domain-containing protein [Acidimicrobiia bacterium]